MYFLILKKKCSTEYSVASSQSFITSSGLTQLMTHTHLVKEKAQRNYAEAAFVKKRPTTKTESLTNIEDNFLFFYYRK
jgi:hypothetical protein